MLTTFAALLFSGAAHAVPGQFTHQGRLLDAEGVPLTDSVTMTFRVMDEPSEGTPLWQENITVSLTNGFYAAILGANEDTNPLDVEVFAQAPLWLEIQLVGEPAMTPRSPIHSVPYATMAGVAEEVSGGPVNATRVAIDGVLVIDPSGAWVGPSAPVNWSDITGMPSGFADGIDDDTNTDTLTELGLSCADDNIPVWDAATGSWLCDVDKDTVLTEEEVDAMVADNGYASASALFSGSYSDLTDIPSDIADGDQDTVLTEEEVDAMVADNGYLTEVDIAGLGGGGGTVIYTRCAWTGEYMPIIGSCTPPECPSPWEDLGITGNVKTGLAAHGSADYSPPYSESSGYQERACFIANSVTVLHTRCAWSGDIATDIDTCSPPSCPSGWSDLGVTGNIKSTVGMYGSTDYSPPYSEASGYQERTCTR